jgi:putative PIN family toxin of toxin-antitoxin system
MPCAAKMIRAVLDSSVLVSAFLTPRGTPATLLARARQGAFSIHLSKEILEETKRALLRPKIIARYRHTVDDVAEYLIFLADVTEAVEDIPTLRAVPLDPKDDMVVATAVKAGAGYLVTGDLRHLVVLGDYEGSRIVTPRQFLEILASG